MPKEESHGKVSREEAGRKISEARADKARRFARESKERFREGVRKSDEVVK